ncbi:MAG: methionyl-tRNA formyltransferase [Chitinispirillales bacterium]|jgi:methionyl-tRNA formyltransferase|nr:methionyl-tRNA formyltransferase [Chitinispirillales bacterium]
MKTVFMGSAEFGLPALEKLLERHDVAAVVSTPARAKGRGLKLFDSPVTGFARERGIGPILTPENLSDADFINLLKSFAPDLFVVVAFRILPKTVFAIPKFGTVNIHASLLPKYRGAAPIHRAIEAGERETGVTVFRIDEGIDTGEIIRQSKILIGNDETTPQLYERLSLLGADVLMESIDELARGDVSPVIQNSAEATRAPKLSKSEGHIDWKLPAEAIYNKIRAFKPFPGTYFFVDGKRVNIEWGAAVDFNINSDITPGIVLYSKGDCIDVQCGDGGILRIYRIKPEGKSAMDVKVFLLGHSIPEGTILK